MNFFKKNWKKILAGALVLVILIVLIGKKKTDTTIQTYNVVRKDVSDTLNLSGKVQAVDRVEMAFATSGNVGSVYKQNGDAVRAGEKIVELDNASLRADLADAVANLDIQKAETKVSDTERDSDVTNAYAKLLSDDLVAYSTDPGNAENAPIVSGRYVLGKEGRYRILVVSSGVTSRKSIRYSGIEKGEQEIVFYKPVPIGHSGLYLQFNQDETSLGDEWMIDIPNVGGASYTSNLNAYKSALASRDASSSGDSASDVTLAKIKQAEARIASINADIEARILRAPFDGIVSKIDIKKGEIAISGTIVATVMSQDKYEVKVQVPEIDIVNMVPGLSADITLDAYGKDVIFPAKVLSVDQSETKVDGVSVYEAKVLFDNPDPRILSGMTANIAILKAKVLNVLAVPKSFIESDETGKFVMVKSADGETETKVYVTTGLMGSNGDIEIMGGVAEGDTLVADFKK